MTRILVVDDVKLFRHMEATALGWRGYSIEEASSGAEALEKIRADPPDLVLLDFYMPGMAGPEVCSRIKSDPALQSLPVIMVTSSSRDEDIRKAVQSGCDDYLTKPLDDFALIRKVEDLLGSVSKRRYPRVPASMQISFEDFKGIFFEYSRDISRNGVFIEMENPLPKDARLKLSFSLPPPFDHPVVAYGRVARVSAGKGGQPSGVGIAFIHIDEDNARVIDALVAGQIRPEEETTGVFSRLSFQLDEPEQVTGRDRPDPRMASLASEYVELQKAMDEMQRDHLRLSAMLAIAEGLLAAGSPGRVVEAASEVLRNLLGAEVFGIFIHDPERGLLVPVACFGLSGHLKTGMPIDGPILQALQNGRVQMPAPAWPLDEDGTVVLAAGGLPGADQGLGVVTIHELFKQKSELTMADQQLLEMLCIHSSRALLDAVAREKAGEPEVGDVLEALVRGS